MTELKALLARDLPHVSPDTTLGDVVSIAKRRSKRRIQGRASVACVVAALAITGAVLGTSSDESQHGATLVALHGRVLPRQTQAADGSIWTLTCNRRCTDHRRSHGRVVRVDAKTARVTQGVPIDGPHALAVGNGAVWITHVGTDTVTRVDPATGKVAATIALKLPTPLHTGSTRFLPFSIATTPGAVWVSTARGWVARIDPATNHVAAMIRTPKAMTGDLTGGPTGPWIALGIAGVGRIDPQSNQASIRAITGPHSEKFEVNQLVEGGGLLWAEGVWSKPRIATTGHRDYVSTDHVAIVGLDPSSLTIERTVRLPTGPWRIAYGDDALWAANHDTGAIRRISPTATSTSTDRKVNAHGLTLAAVTTHGLWMTQHGGTLRKITIN